MSAPIRPTEFWGLPRGLHQWRHRPSSRLHGGSDCSLPYLRAKAGAIERPYEVGGIEVASDLKARGPRFGRVAGYALHGGDCLLDGHATWPAAVMDARDLQAFDLALGNVAHGLHRQLVIVGAAVESSGGKGRREPSGPWRCRWP